MSLKEFFEYAYTISTPKDDCRNCESFSCQNTCEPGATNAHGENLLLLPGEFEFIGERLGEEPKWIKHGGAGYIEVGFVPPGMSCPYWEGGKCQIFKDRPIRCRSYPLLTTKEGEGTLGVWSALQCPKSQEELHPHWGLNQHYTAWVGIWKGLVTYVSDEWWDMSKKLTPGGFKLLFHYIDDDVAKSGKFSDSTARAAADPDCTVCNGEGKTSDYDLCSCTLKHLKSEMETNTDTIFQ